MFSCSHTRALTRALFSASKAALGVKQWRSLRVHEGVDIPSKSEMMPKPLHLLWPLKSIITDSLCPASLALLPVGLREDP